MQVLALKELALNALPLQALQLQLQLQLELQALQ